MSPDFVPVTDSDIKCKGKPLKLSGFPFKSAYYRFETSAFKILNQSALVKERFLYFIEAMSITKRYFTSLLFIRS
jgi:hypothetical protein